MLGDRIAIMHAGRVMCMGSSHFLKEHYGVGYTFTVSVTQGADIRAINQAIKVCVCLCVPVNVHLCMCVFVLCVSVFVCRL